MAGNVVKLVFETVSKGNGVTKFCGELQKTTSAAQKAIGAARGIAGAFSSVGGSAGGAVGAVAQFVGAFQQLGAVGGLIAGVQIAIDKLGGYMTDKAEELVEKTQKMMDKASASLSKAVSRHMKPVDEALGEASTKAKDAAAAFNNLASAYLKVATAQDLVEKSARGAAMSGIELEKSRKMSAAGSDAERAMIAADYDRKIARANLDATTEEQNNLVGQASDNLMFSNERASAAAYREKMAAKAVRVAQREYDNTHDENGVGLFKGAEAFKSKLEAAQRNLEESTRERIAQEAEAEAAELKLQQAKLDQAAAINRAKQGVEEADAAQKKLAKVQRESEAAERDRVRKERAAADQAARREALQSAHDAAKARAGELASASSAYQSQFERAFDLWRDPEAAKSAQDAAIKRDDDMKRYRKAVSRYFGKSQIDETARLMREGDTEGVEARMSEWRKSSRFSAQTEQLVRAAAAEQNKQAADKALIDIEKNTRDLSKKLDDLLKLKG